jgi:isoleucyl-tRNA synthetase
VSSADYRGDLAVSNNIMKQTSEAYRKIRNTSRFLLGNIYDFDPGKDRVAYTDMQDMDRWALLRLHRMIEKVLSAYKDYEYHTVYHAVHNFCTVDMSALYLDMIKDRLYTSPPASPARRSAQTVLYDVLQVLVRLLTPVLAFTSEEIWRYIPKSPGAPESVQLTDMPVVNEQYLDMDLEQKWERLLGLRAVVTRALETARQEKKIGNSLEAVVELYARGDLYTLLSSMPDDLSTIFIVSGVRLQQADCPPGAAVSDDIKDFGVVVSRAAGEKCERCWMYHDAVGKDTAHPLLCPRCAAVIQEVS